MQPAYVVTTMGPPGGIVPEGASTARTLILIALVFQTLSTFVLLAIFTLFLAIIFLGPAAWIFFVAGGVVVGLAVFMLYVGYAWSYRRTKTGDYRGARTPTLILGILGLLFGFIIVGVLYLIAYVKLGEAERSATMPMVMAPVLFPQVYAMPWAPGVPGGMAPSYATATPSPPTSSSGTPLPSASEASTVLGPPCPRCQAATKLIPEYNRYYCTACARYT